MQWYNKWYFYLLFIIGIPALSIIIHFPNLYSHYRTFSIPAKSNAPTLQVGDRIVAKMKYPKNSEILPPSEYKTGSLILFTIPDNYGKTFFIKRMVAQGGDKYFIRAGVAYLNNRPVTEPYVLATNNKKSYSINFGPVTVPANSVLVLGDNRDCSRDSRDFGFIPTKNIIAKALYIYWSHDFHRIGLRLD